MVAEMDKVFNRKEQVPIRRELRNHPTAAEASLWYRLRGSRLGVKFRRQHGIGPYVVDFYCPTARLAIELDGDSHCSQEVAKRDSMRQAWMEAQGVRVLRFLNDDVFNDIEAVLAVLHAIFG